VPTKPQTPRGPQSVWQQRRHQPGWLILPLRAFLGITFVYAGLQKLANPDYLDPAAPTSVVRQMAGLRHTTPLGPLLGLSLHAPTLVGLLIAFGELAVGLGTLLGLLTRIAATGGALLALTFFLTVSWATTPYYYGADIVFVFAWTVLIAFGSGGVLSLDGWLADRARRDVGLGRRPAEVTIAAPRLKELCARGAKCGLDEAGRCRRPSGCPIFSADDKVAARTGEALARRTVVVTAVAAAVTGAAALITAGLAASIGRAVGGTPQRRRVAAGTGPPAPASSATAPSSSAPATTAAPPSGTVIAAESSIAVGDAKSFTNPADGNPAFLVHTSATKFVAFSAVCTHAGCPVQFDKANTAFVCPCHGGAYDARTGQVLQGPPPAPLAPIAVQVVGGQVRTG
jgi:thiosulfate dehydrogenase [quinone] large subunit